MEWMHVVDGGSKRRNIIEKAIMPVEYERILSSQITKKKWTRITKKTAEVYAELVVM